MTINLPAFRSSRSGWRQLKDALFTAYVNWHIRRAERIEPEFIECPQFYERCDSWRRA